MLEPVQFCVGTSSLVVPGPVGYRSQGEVQVNNARPNILQMQPLPYNIRKGELQTANFRSRSSRVKCSAVLDARCAAASATQTLVRRSRTTTISPEKVKSPKLDDNGPGLPPRDNDGNGGNGGGGGGKFSGGLILLGILGILDILKDIECEWLRNRKHRRFLQA
ncbi:hypothetical protein HN51_047304 [Arachis hypogaea]|uniref:Uncharacterized protein n=1 Tax=Arachis hypogaea TaxID=3818 RepID=A0A445AG90_ARAHY|nr:uncharacterized protein LOC107625202 [Arachis ipaensis]XP_016183268.1 uncharacterized protein LOC107625202 [Arachis ipaensis]XP_016183270.1 uncharacterized protein LOC107625202 [Arachis ipaensis]XP_020971390.1 uncharacterized protein LOC107625202 [Arachis ipaensis]XP_025632735.1 protein YELLOW LEAF 1, choloroplastic [Arachis hypogaea]XP_025632736.1 protein YELLOW LEAF 1, choloroplastic [Arachis hypogaea]XP_025632737.1 protein YELLOW LEAF 1, choloroplastic [Arachis hypogaea]QHO23628.1 unch